MLTPITSITYNNAIIELYLKPGYTLTGEQEEYYASKTTSSHIPVFLDTSIQNTAIFCKYIECENCPLGSWDDCSYLSIFQENLPELFKDHPELEL